MDTTGFKVEDLTDGDEYEFRVVAHNEAGPSRPSTTVGPIVVQDQTCETGTPSSCIMGNVDVQLLHPNLRLLCCRRSVH